MCKRTTSSRGFTLVELIIVLNIAAILVALLIPAYRTVTASRSEASCKARLGEIFAAIQEFKQDNKRYPEWLGELYQDKYLQSKTTFVCPADLRNQAGAKPDEGGYGYDLLYAKREANEPGQEILDGCPFHKKALVLTTDGKIEKGAFQDAEITSVTGAASIIRWNSDWQDGQWARETASTGKKLHVGDTVATAPTGIAVIKMDNSGSNVTVDKNTEFTINLAKKADDPSSLIRLASIRAALTGTVGHITAIVDPSDTGIYKKGGGRFEISTPSAVAAVRGTNFDLWTLMTGETQLQVNEGTVEFFGNGTSQKVNRSSGPKKSDKDDKDDDDDDNKKKSKRKKHD